MKLFIETEITKAQKLPKKELDLTDSVLVRVSWNKRGDIRYIIPTYVYIDKNELEENKWRTVKVCGTDLSNIENENS